MVSLDDDSSLDSVLRGVAASPPRSPPPRWVVAVRVRVAQDAPADAFEQLRKQSAGVGSDPAQLPDGTVRLTVEPRGTPSGDAVVAAFSFALALRDAFPGARIALAAERVAVSGTAAGEAAQVRAASVLEADSDPGIFVDETTAGLAARAFEFEARGALLRVVARREGALGVAAPSPGTTVGRFVLLEPLGAGGTAVVWAAYDPQLARKIALKFLHSDVTLGHDVSRLVREAQALARLSHPNVLTIHDVGTTGGALYIAEELAPGGALGDYLKASPRSLATILTLFLQAGEGLSAAHHAGLVHRDFKPANVLLGADGRARVADFGLVRLVDGAPEPPEPHPPATTAGVAPEPGSEASLTRTGALLGTPAYMAPEQHEGKDADARSDQFAFAVSLYAALYGELPFGAGTPRELLAAIQQGTVREPPRGSRVPSWIRAVLVRGLAPDPEARYPSMDDLLRDLRRDPSVARRRWLAAGGSLLLAGLVVAGAVRASSQRSHLCSGAERQLEGVWDEAKQRAGKASFLATGLPYAAFGWGSAAAALDAYTKQWAAMHTEACEATRLRGEQSEEVLDLRMTCLSERLAEVRATADLFTTADEGVVRRAAQTAGALGSLSDCADLEALRAPVRPPTDHEARQKVDEARAHLAQAKAFHAAGKYKDALRVAGEVVTTARSLAYRPLEAEALTQVGTTEVTLTGGTAAEASLSDAFATALSCRHVEAAAQSGTALVVLLGYRLGRQPEAFKWARLAQAELDAQGGNQEIEAKLATNLGLTYDSLGKYDDALAQHRRALALRLATFGPAHATVGMVRNNVGNALEGKGDYAGALEEYRAALAIKEQALGPNHPDVSTTLLNIGIALQEQGHYADALVAYNRSLAIVEEVFGPDSRDAAEVHTNIGDAYRAERSFAEALPHYQHALAIQEKELAADHPDVSWTLGGLGAAYLGLGQFSEATKYLERAVAISATNSPTPEVVAEQHFALARALWVTPAAQKRALEFGRKARTEYADLPSRKKEQAAVAEWLAARDK